MSILQPLPSQFDDVIHLFSRPLDQTKMRQLSQRTLKQCSVTRSAHFSPITRLDLRNLLAVLHHITHESLKYTPQIRDIDQRLAFEI